MDHAWLHDLDPFAIRPFLRWYGLAYLAGFLIGWVLLVRLARRGRTLFEDVKVADLLMALIIGVIVGGRLGYILIYQPSLLWSFTSDIPWWGALAVNRGGMASHGGMIGVAAAAVWFARRERVPFLHVTDCVCLVAPIGLLLGRLANFVNGELLGRIVVASGEPGPWWTVRYPQELEERVTAEQQIALLEVAAQRGGPMSYDAAAAWAIEGVQSGNPEMQAAIAPILNARAPSQLMQAVFEGAVVLAVLWFVWRRPRRAGVISAWFLIVYGVGRIFTEFWRLPDAHLQVAKPLGLTRGQWLSTAMIVGGVLLLLWAIRRGGPRIGGWLQRAQKPDVRDAGSENESVTA